MNNERNGCRRVCLFWNEMKSDRPWCDFSMAEALSACQCLSGGVRHGTSQGKNASTWGGLALCQSVVLVLAIFVFEVGKR